MEHEMRNIGGASDEFISRAHANRGGWGYFEIRSRDGTGFNNLDDFLVLFRLFCSLFTNL